MRFKHKCKAANPATCTNPRCPERRAIESAFQAAVQDEDYHAMFNARAEMEKFKPQYIRKAKHAEEWDQLVLEDEPGQWKAIGILPEKIGHSYDTATVPSFNSFEDINSFFQQDKNVFFQLSKTFYNDDEEVTGWTVGEFFISPALRGQGVGEWMMKIVTKHADENNSLLFLTPTSAGDKKITSEHPNYKEKALEHRRRITSFYNRHGFTSNPFWIPIGWKDELTGEDWSRDEQEMATYTKQAREYLSAYQTPQLVRVPSQGWPKRWGRKVQTQR